MSVISTFGFIVGMLLLGRILVAGKVVRAEAAQDLNQLVLYVCLPASVLLFAPKLTLNMELVGLVAIPWLLLLVGAGFVLLAQRMFHFDRATRGVLLLAVPLGNTSFLGFPLIQSLLGDQALAYAVAYDQFGSFFIICSYGLYVLALHGAGDKPTLSKIAIRVVRFPPFIALLLALTIMPVQYPPAIEWMLSRLADVLLPLVTLAIGMQLKFRMPREELLPLAVGAIGKLFLLPLIALGLATLLGLSGDLRSAAILESAMPTMITAMALASLQGLSPRLASALVAYGILLSMLSLPFWLWIVKITH